MSAGEIYRRKAEALLQEAARASDLGERSRLISAAVRWHMQALEADGGDPAEAAAGGAMTSFHDPDAPEPDAI